MNGTIKITSEVTRREYTFENGNKNVTAQGIADTDTQGIKTLNASVYDGQRTYIGNFNGNRQGDGTLRVNYSPQTDADLDTLLEVKLAVVAELTANVTEEEEQE